MPFPWLERVVDLFRGLPVAAQARVRGLIVALWVKQPPRPLPPPSRPEPPNEPDLPRFIDRFAERNSDPDFVQRDRIYRQAISNILADLNDKGLKR